MKRFLAHERQRIGVLHDMTGVFYHPSNRFYLRFLGFLALNRSFCPKNGIFRGPVQQNPSQSSTVQILAGLKYILFSYKNRGFTYVYHIIFTSQSSSPAKVLVPPLHVCVYTCSTRCGILLDCWTKPPKTSIECVIGLFSVHKAAGLCWTGMDLLD